MGFFHLSITMQCRLVKKILRLSGVFHQTGAVRL